MIQTVQNLEQVHGLIPQLYSASSAKVMQAAVRRAAVLTGRRLDQITADAAAWQALTRQLVWAGQFRGRTPSAAERAFEDWRAKVAAAIRAAQRHATAPNGPEVSEAKAAWDVLYDYVKSVENTRDETGALRMPNMASLSLANLRARVGAIHPRALDRAAAEAALRETGHEKSATFRRSCAFFDTLVANRVKHPAIDPLLPAAPLGRLAGLRDAPVDFSKLDAGLVAGLDAAIELAIAAPSRRMHERLDAALGAHPFEARGSRQGRRKRVRKPALARRAFRGACSWLIRHGFRDADTAAGLRRLDDLFKPEVIRRAVDAYIERANADPALKNASETSTGSSYLTRLMTLATRNGLHEDVLFALDDALCRDEIDTRADMEMSASRREFLRLLDADPAVVRAIVSGPHVLLAEVKRDLAKFDTLGVFDQLAVLKRGLAATMLAIQLARPLRTLNVNELTVGVDGAELRRPRGTDATGQIVLDRRRVKNRKDIEHAVPTHLWDIVAFWLDELRDRWIAAHARQGFTDNAFLFPGEKGPISRALLNMVWSAAMRRIGVPGLTPHMLRHVCATVYLARHPGDYAVVAALLRDSQTTVERFYARGAGREAARLFAEVLAELNPRAGALLGAAR